MESSSKFSDNVWYKLRDDAWLKSAKPRSDELKDIIITLHKIIKDKVIMVKSRCGFQINELVIHGISFGENFEYHELLNKYPDYCLLTDCDAEFFEPVQYPIFIKDENNKTKEEIQSLIEWHLTETNKLILML